MNSERKDNRNWEVKERIDTTKKVSALPNF